MGGDGSPRARTGSVLSRVFSREVTPSIIEPSESGPSQNSEVNGNDTIRGRPDASPFRKAMSTSINQRTPARTYFHHSGHDSHAPTEIGHNTPQSVREDTAELASWAMSEWKHNGQSPPRHGVSAIHQDLGQMFSKRAENEYPNLKDSDASSKPSAIEEMSEPTASKRTSRSSSKSQGKSALSDMIQSSPPEHVTTPNTEDGDLVDSSGFHIVTVQDGIISQPTERTTLLLKKAAYRSDISPTYGSVQDLESLNTMQQETIGRSYPVAHRIWGDSIKSVRVIANPRYWTRREVWANSVRLTFTYMQSVVIGLLLNILDAVSYGMILFPLSQAVFADLGPDGICMFYISCIISQLVFSCGGSVFKGGIGSEMIEVVPFFHSMAFSILNQVGEQNPRAVRATTIIAFSVSSIITGLVFYLMGLFRVGALIGFFPRHILLGCIGGVGLFLFDTALEVSSRLDGGFEYDIPTLKYLFQLEKLPLWMLPLGLAIALLIAKRWVKHPGTDSTFFISIIVIFYVFQWALPDLNMPELRSKGWVFEAPEADTPFYHFYTLYDFKAVDWNALLRTFPAMLALTFFGILHVPINIPALAITTGEDNVDVDRELRAHGLSNALSGFCGSIQNYLVYTNTVIFMRSGGDSRVAGVMLAIATGAVLVSGMAIIGFIPVMVVGALIFYLGLQLMGEALVDTWGTLHRLEYLTVIIIVITMGVWDFVIGILLGIVLACVSFVLQTSQISAIRSTIYGGIANSTVRRPYLQQRFLQDAGSQIHVMKLAGYLFFGTIVGVEKQVRQLLDESFRQQPIRFLIMDLFNVDGVDYSAAEAFLRVNRILGAKSVQLVVCGLSFDGEVGKSLRKVGLFDDESCVQYFLSLNSALEFSENELLRTFYHQQGAEEEGGLGPASVEVPRPQQKILSTSEGLMYSSPRQNHLHHVATMTLSEQDAAPPPRWQEYKQPLQLILQIFSKISTQPEDFWSPAARYFERKDFAVGTTLYHIGERAKGFFLVETGILKAKYDLPQGKYSELILAGTTCGELPFFSSTVRTATTQADRDCRTWMLTQDKWALMQQEEPTITQELLQISLRLTSERMDAITKYMLLTSG